MSTSLGPDASRAEIELELLTSDVLIESLDTGAEDYESRLRQLQETQRELEARLDVLVEGEQGVENTRSTEGVDPDHQVGSEGPVSGRNENYQSGYAEASLFGTKRPATDSMRLEARHPYKRPTPEPSNFNSPNSSVESLHLSDGSNDRAKLRQRVAEAALMRQRQAEMEMEDERLARQLNQEYASTSSASFISRPTFQTTMNPNGSYDRPPAPPAKVNGSSHTANHSNGITPAQRQTYERYASRTLPSPSNTGGWANTSSLKKEPGQTVPPPPPPPPYQPGQSYSTPSQSVQPRRNTAVIDLTASDDEEDITEIDRTRFTPNGRASRPAPPMPNFQSPLTVRGSLHAPSSMHIPGAWPTDRHDGYQSVYGSVSTVNGFNTGLGAVLGHGQSRSIVQQARVAATGQLRQSWDIGSQVLSALDLFDNSANESYDRRYNELMDNNPEKTREEINALIENIRPDEDIPAHMRVQTPKEMSIQLHKYQELGLTWLKNMEEGSNKGGILADEMGLGKTIQMLGLIVTRKSEDQFCKTTLVIAPVALMRQWKQEIEQKIKPSYRLTVFIHHGQSKKKSFHDLRQYDIVLSTYGTLAAEVKKLEQFRLRQKNEPNARPTEKEQCALLGEDAKWYRVILDEAQCIKNRSTRTSQAACYLEAKYRFCMTGTPMMNSVVELHSLLKFLRIQPYCRWEKFRLEIAQQLNPKSHRGSDDPSFQAAMKRLQGICKAVMMRRTKKSTFEGQPILVLPEVVRNTEHPEFSEDEWGFYRAVEGKMRIQFNRYVQAGTVNRNYTAILVLLLRLRQAACHPHLLKDFSIAATAGLTEEAVIDFAKSLDPQVVARIKAVNGMFECPVCYDVVENPAIFIPCGHDTCRECFSRITDPSNAIREGNEGQSQAKCPTCRSAIDPNKITAFDAFKKVHQPELLTEEEKEELRAEQDPNEDEDDDSETASEGSDDDNDDDDDDYDEVDKNGNLRDFVVKDDEELEEDDNDDVPVPGSEDDDAEEGVAGPSSRRKKAKSSGSEDTKRKSKSKKLKKRKKKKKKKKNSGPKKEVNLADLAKLSHRNIKARKRYLRRLRETYKDSAKIRKTMELLKRIMEDPEGEKVLVFSQWTSLLDLVEIPIDGEGWDYRRYDGSMNAKMRADAVDDFRDHRKSVRIMLVSLKAGNAGLNLTAASQVIILDPFWNPYIEEQAIDRAHRIGQEREVKVHRMLIPATIEDRIVEIQESKQQLIGAALDEQSSQRIARLGTHELSFLFGVTNRLEE